MKGFTELERIEINDFVTDFKLQTEEHALIDVVGISTRYVQYDKMKEPDKVLVLHIDKWDNITFEKPIEWKFKNQNLVKKVIEIIEFWLKHNQQRMRFKVSKPSTYKYVIEDVTEQLADKKVVDQVMSQ